MDKSKFSPRLNYCDLAREGLNNPSSLSFRSLPGSCKPAHPAAQKQAGQQAAMPAV